MIVVMMIVMMMVMVMIVYADKVVMRYEVQVYKWRVKINIQDY